MSYWKLRIDSHDKALIQPMLDRYCDKYVWTREYTNGNPHSHFYIELKMLLKDRNVRNYITKHFGKGNGVYSMGKLDVRYPVEYLSYILKDDKKPIHNIPSEILEDALKFKAVKTKEKRSKVVFKLIEESPDFQALIKNETVTPLKVYDIVIDYYLKNNKLVHESMLIATCRTLLIRNNSDYSNEYRDKIKYML